MTVELSRPMCAVENRSRRALTVVVRATPEECAAVAARMELPAIRSLAMLLPTERRRRRRFGLGRRPSAGRGDTDLRGLGGRIRDQGRGTFRDPVRARRSRARRSDPTPICLDEIPYEGTRSISARRPPSNSGSRWTPIPGSRARPCRWSTMKRIARRSPSWHGGSGRITVRIDRPQASSGRRSPAASCCNRAAVLPR